MLNSSKIPLGGLFLVLIAGLALIIGTLVHRHTVKHKYCQRPFPSGVSLKYCETSHKYAVCIGYGPIHITKPYSDEDSTFIANQYLGEKEIDYIDTHKQMYLTTPPNELQFDDSCLAKNYYFEKVYIRDSLAQVEYAKWEHDDKIQDSLNIINHCYK